MRAETESVVNDIRESVDPAPEASLTPIRPRQRLAALDREAEAPNFWSDSRRAQSLMRERQQLESALGTFDRIVRELDDHVALIELGEEEGDEHVVAEAETALMRLRQEAHTREVEALLSGEADANDAYVEIHAGRGRHREPGLGADARTHVCALGGSARLQGRDHRRALSAKRPASSRRPC